MFLRSRCTPVDGALLAVVAFENLSGGMGTPAHVAFQTALCQQRFTATQFALLSAFGAVGRVRVGPLAGVLAASIGWPDFFIISTVVAVRGRAGFGHPGASGWRIRRLSRGPRRAAPECGS